MSVHITTPSPEEAIHDEIVRVYDFADTILDAVELDNDVAVDTKVELVAPVVEELRECADVMSEVYLSYIENGRKIDKANMKRLESAIRKVFIIARQFIDQVQQLPLKARNAAYKVSANITAILDKVRAGILPTQEELGRGKIRNTMEMLVQKYGYLANIIRACEQGFTHIFRITYRLAAPDIGIVHNPQDIIWGRSMADSKRKPTSQKDTADKDKFEKGRGY